MNNDGKQDIYVSVAGYQVDTAAMENLLYINQGCGKDGVPIFVEAAADYGLNDSGYSTQGAFFDYDKDGDLDLYLLTNAMETFDRNKIKPKRINGEAASTDRLYRNNGDATFTDVSRAAGILIEGYGLGVTVSDLNLDGFPDVYVANDFLSNDLVWMNNGDGTFTDRAPQMLQHQSHNGMGVDIADFNNDALPDIAVLDMLPEDNYRQKMMTSYVDKDKFLLKKSMGYQDQYMRNTLQLHGGFSQNDLPQYHEIGNLSGL
ncbi:MAG: VCBS repeat-containing protein, partial [Bacteroidota bacterium]